MSPPFLCEDGGDLDAQPWMVHRMAAGDKMVETWMLSMVHRMAAGDQVHRDTAQLGDKHQRPPFRVSSSV
jgi:hypothetical protein